MRYKIRHVKSLLIIVAFSICCSKSYSQCPPFTDCSKTTGPDPGFLFIPRDEARSYIKNYRENFKRKRKGTHTKSIYFKREYFCFFRKFFTEHGNDYKRIRIYFIHYNSLLSQEMEDRKQITLMFAPVRNSDCSSDFDVFDRYCKEDPTRFSCKKRAEYEAEFETERIKENERIRANHGDLCPNNCDCDTDDLDPEIGEDCGKALIVQSRNTLSSTQTVCPTFNRTIAERYKKNYKKHIVF